VGVFVFRRIYASASVLSLPAVHRRVAVEPVQTRGLVMKRLGRLNHDWHVALNAAIFRKEPGRDHIDKHMWMYEAKHMADEVPRMTMLFALERTGKLPAVHRQCSHSKPEQIPDNHLTCCLNVACRTCPFLAIIDTVEATPEERDEMKAWTCATHIQREAAAGPNHIDTSEGYIKTTSDQMYWERVYNSLSGI
jgi:hypothetical protein